MKTILMFVASAAITLAACAKQPAAAAQQDAAAADTVTQAGHVGNYGLYAGEVNRLANDTIFRPDTKVNMVTVLDFTATWCGPCRMFHPVFEAAARKFGRAVFVSVDVDRNPLTAHAFAIQGVPTVIILKPDGTLTTFVGLNDIYPESAFFNVMRQALGEAVLSPVKP